MNSVILGSSVRDWALALGSGALLFVLVMFVRHVVLVRLVPRAGRTATHLDDFLVTVLNSTRFLFVLFISIAITVHFLDLPPRVDRLLGILATAALILQVAIWGNAIVTFWVRRYVATHATTHAESVTAIEALAFVGRLLLFVVLFLVFLANLGVNVTGLVAGLGVSGIAVALAVQSLLGDLLGAMSIIIGKPFVIGESIAIDKHEGTVEALTLRSTRLRGVDGELIVVPNKHILENRVRNLSQMKVRRVELALAISAAIGPAQAAQIPALLEQAVSAADRSEKRDLVHFDRASLRGIVDGALAYDIVYYLNTRDGGTHVEIRQQVLLGALERLAAANIPLALPPDVRGSRQ